MQIDPNRYYIFDCNGKMIGNPFGYKTHGAAHGQTKKNGSVLSMIYRARNENNAKGIENNLLFSIKIGSMLQEAA